APPRSGQQDCTEPACMNSAESSAGARGPSDLGSASLARDHGQWVAPREASPRVLIVDDDDESRTRVANALRTMGYVVDEVANGLDALKQFGSCRPQIALLEVMTPFLDGFSICRAMRELPGGDEVSIVLMTDVDDIESLQFGYDA